MTSLRLKYNLKYLRYDEENSEKLVEGFSEIKTYEAPINQGCSPKFEAQLSKRIKIYSL